MFVILQYAYDHGNLESTYGSLWQRLGRKTVNVLKWV